MPIAKEVIRIREEFAKHHLIVDVVNLLGRVEGDCLPLLLGQFHDLSVVFGTTGSNVDEFTRLDGVLQDVERPGVLHRSLVQDGELVPLRLGEDPRSRRVVIGQYLQVRNVDIVLLERPSVVRREIGTDEGRQ